MSEEFSASGEPGSLLRAMIRDGIVPPVPDELTEQRERAMGDFLRTGRLDLSRYVSTLDTQPPKLHRPGLKKGDRVPMVWGGCTSWVVTDVDDDGNGTLEPADDA